MLLKFDNEADWLAARAHDVTSTEVAALFGLHPFKSRLRLWYEKRGDIEPDFVETDNSKWGRRLQIPVGLGICEDEGWTGYDLTGYYFTDTALRQGCSLDLRAATPDGDYILEVKISDAFREKDGWTDIAAPLHYEFQLQDQLHLAEKDNQSMAGGVIGTLGRRQGVKLYPREYDASVGHMIDDEVGAFWESIRTDTPPAPDYAVDGELLERLRKPLRAGDVVNLSANARALELADQFDKVKAARKALKDQLKPLDVESDKIKAEIYALMGRNETAIIGPYRIGGRVQHKEERIDYGSSSRRFDFTRRK